MAFAEEPVLAPVALPRPQLGQEEQAAQDSFGSAQAAPTMRVFVVNASSVNALITVTITCVYKPNLGLKEFP